ncbi:MAG: purine-nucleoside phosphorylase [Chloroflexi bacterium]|nr:purine-nucleoside phosphorylase [Chloroflexota bacterium]
MPLHLRAEPGDYAPIVLLPGDPNRATRIASLFDGGLESARRVNDHRGLYGYTGTFRDVPVSVQTTGMGTPSLSIVVEELLMLGATRLIRVGTCGGIGPGMKTGDLVVATGAAAADGSTRTYLHGEPGAFAPDFTLTRALVEAADARGVAVHLGPVATVDVFYNPDAEYATTWRARGVLAFEMEASALFYLASRAAGSGADVRAACALTVSDMLTKDMSESEETYLPLDELERATDRMVEIALEAGTGTGTGARRSDG